MIEEEQVVVVNYLKASCSCKLRVRCDHRGSIYVRLEFDVESGEKIVVDVIN